MILSYGCSWVRSKLVSPFRSIPIVTSEMFSCLALLCATSPITKSSALSNACLTLQAPPHLVAPFRLRRLPQVSRCLCTFGSMFSLHPSLASFIAMSTRIGVLFFASMSLPSPVGFDRPPIVPRLAGFIALASCHLTHLNFSPLSLDYIFTFNPHIHQHPLYATD